MRPPPEAPAAPPPQGGAASGPAKPDPRRPLGEGPPPAEEVELFLPCAAGCEELLAAEVQQILGPEAGGDLLRGGITVRGGCRWAMQLNLESRLAQRVLWPLASGPYASAQDLYALARTVDWAAWIAPQQTLRVDTTAQRSPLQSLNFATLTVKDAVCDTLREATGARPSVDTRHPHLPIQLHLGPEQATLYVDLSGEALFKRGWRDARGGSVDVKGEAPLKETLAAAMLAAAGWQGRAEDGPLFDPCCGAGTIAIEAAQIACGIAPGLQRRFAFERLAPFAALRGEWAALQQAARARRRAPAVPVFAGDVSFRMTDFAQRNAERAGVAEAIQFKTADALQRLPPAERGTLMLNPPYGERIAAKGSRGEARAPRAPREGFVSRPPGADAAVAAVAAMQALAEPAADADGQAFFSRLATHWKHHYPGWTAWVLSPDMQLPRALRLKESRRVPLWNGAIECRLFRFDLVAGSARAAP